MQGLWKNNLYGYNEKGSRRKRNKRKYFIRDKGAAIIKRIGFKSKKHKNGHFLSPLVFRKESEGKEFIYNKPFYWSDIRYDRGRRKAYAKKMIDRQIRASVREWISRGDWDKERRTLDYEKSFAWYID